MKQKFKIGFIGSKNTTYDCMQRFLADSFQINQLITLTKEKAGRFQVAGYMDLVPFAKKNNIPVYCPQKYSLKNDKDIETIKKMKLDILITIGWQRLIPDKILKSLTIGACGMHGSAMGLPLGKGRSPLNWSLVQDKKRFITSLILYTPEIDAGDIVGSQEFDINPYDTCETLHFKNMIAMSRLLKKSVVPLLTKKLKPKKQKGRSTFYPQRKPEDGVIDWNMTSKKIYNSVRAQTHPFHGAFTYLKNKKMTIWQAQPFDSKLKYPNNKNGEIVEIFYNKNILIKTKDGSLLVTNFEGIPSEQIKKGRVFTSVSHKKTLKNIIKRYPAFVKDSEKEIRL